ncbi:MAG: FecR domain-containing protein [Ferruginibacter sp.]|nr:FecR domain-containing protein [Cytophagales bacterium]
MSERIDKPRLFDYFAGKATALERQQIDEWSGDPVHEEQFYEWLDEWEQSHRQYTADQPAALNRYHDFLFAAQSNAAQPSAAQPGPVPSARAPTRSIGRLNRPGGIPPNGLGWAVVASVTVVVGLFGFREQVLTRTYSTAYGETRTVTLPDGSGVVLNANSSLRMPRFGFGSHTRAVRLTGEALFSVTHTATNQRFVVKTDNGPLVVVLGTEFTVFARPRGTKVTLNRGRVEVHYRQPDRRTRQVTMKPGDLVTLTPKGEVRRQQNQQPSANPAWTDHRFVFDKTPLTEIVAMLDESYGLTVEIADAETGQLTLSGAYPARNADEMLCILAEVLNLTIIRQNDTVLLTPKAI